MASRTFYRSLLVLLLVYSLGSWFFAYASQTLFFLIIIALILVTFRNYRKIHKPLRLPSSLKNENQLISFFICWQLFSIFRGLLFNYASAGDIIVSTFTNQFASFALLLPIVALTDFENFNFQFFKKASIFFCLTGFVLLYFNYDVIFNTTYVLTTDDETISYGALVARTTSVVSMFGIAGFNILLSKYYDKKTWRFFVVCALTSFVLLLMSARRGSSVTMLLILASAGYLYIQANPRKKFVRNILIICIAVMGVLYVVRNMDTTFSMLNQRLEVNNREDVNADFIDDISRGLDWIWGRGVNGSYINKSYYTDMDFGAARTGLETGYLFIILTSGVIGLFCYLWIMLKAAWKGWYRSNNMLCKAFALYIAIGVVSLIPFGLPAFSVQFLLYWIGVAFCLNNRTRSLSDDEIKQIYFK